MPRSSQTGFWKRSARRWLAGTSLLVIFSGAHAVALQDAAPAEYELKAAVLYNFAKFVDWPPGTFPNAEAPFQFCILGHDPFGKALKLMESRQIGSRQVRIIKVTTVDAAASCQVVFISESERKRVADTLEFLLGRPILTVGDTPGFGKAGVMINLLLEDDKIVFEVNLRTADRSHVSVSSKLLALARNVIRPQERQGQ
jgi:hypothetical protein